MKITDSISLPSASETTKAQTDQAQTTAFADALKKAAAKGDKVALKSACQDFESIFVQMIFKQMRQAEPQDGLIEKSQGQDIFEGMLDEEMSKKISHGAGIGLADVLYKQMEKYVPDSAADTSKEAAKTTPSIDIKG